MCKYKATWINLKPRVLGRKSKTQIYNNSHINLKMHAYKTTNF